MKVQTEIMLLIVMAASAARSQTVQVLPHIAVGGQFTTDILVLNTGTAAASASLSFLEDDGKLMTINFPDLGFTASGLHTQSPIPPGGSIFVEAADPNGPTRTGSAFITADAGITVQALFRSKASDGSFYEASVPSTVGSTRFTLAFDATTFQPSGAQIYTGIAVVNLDSAKSATVTCTAKDSSGVAIPNAVILPPLPPFGHWAGYAFPALVGKRGILDCVSGVKVGAIGLRFLGTNAFSSLPVVQSTAPTGTASTPTNPTNASSIVGSWVTIGPDYLIFYDDGHVDNYTTLSDYIPRQGTYQVSQSTITVQWSAWLGGAPQTEQIKIVQSGNTTTLVRFSNITYSRD